MNCFEWQNQASDALDGRLIPSDKDEADHHLGVCPDCRQHLRNYKILVDVLAHQPRSSLPVPIRRAPLSAPLPRRSGFNGGRVVPGIPQELPWHYKTLLEGLGIVFVILGAVALGPRIRRFYERGTERSLSDFNQSFEEMTPTTGLTPKSATESSQEARPSDRALAETPESEDDFSGGGESDERAPGAELSAEAGREIHVGRSEIWRFILKTEKPDDLRGKIIRLLTELQVPPTRPGARGIEVPGGIEFDLLVPQTAIPALKRELEAMAPELPRDHSQSVATETFTWYKNKSKHALPEHLARLVIWLSQI